MPQAAPPRPPFIALLVGDLDDHYQLTVTGGVRTAAAERGVELVCISAGELHSPVKRDWGKSELLHRIAPATFDGVIVLSGAVGAHLGPEGLARFLRRFSRGPASSVAWCMPGSPAVLVDNSVGVRSAVHHLLDVHRLTRIAFIRGPSRNEEAEIRFGAYRDAMRSRGLFDTRLVETGDWTRKSGAEAVVRLLESNPEGIDAVIAADDFMALGAQEALIEMGQRVPEDVAVVGFDDVEDGRYANPPLTTIRQPLREQGRRALDQVLAGLRGEDTNDLVLPTELVVRESCGCIGTRSSLVPPSDPRPPPDLAQDSFRDALVFALQDAAGSLPSAHRDKWLTQVVRSVQDELLRLRAGRPEPTRFLEEVRTVLRSSARAVAAARLTSWHEVLWELRRHLVPALSADQRLAAQAEAMLLELRNIVSAIVEQAQARERIAYGEWSRALAATTGALVTTFDEAQLGAALTTQLTRLRIHRFWICRYLADTDDGLQRVELVAGSDGRRGYGSDVEPFLASEVLPRALRGATEHGWVLLPLFFQETALGYALVEHGPTQGFLYEALRDQLSAVLQGLALAAALTRRDRERAELLADLEQRHRALERANRELAAKQQQLITAEKMASIGRLTASIAHEMKTPLAAVRSSLRELRQLVGEYRASIGDDDVSDDDHRAIADDMARIVDVADRATARSADFVHGIKTQTRDLGPLEQVTFDAVRTTREALLLLGADLRQAGCEVDLLAEGEPLELSGSPGRLAQVVTNLVGNAADAMKEQGGGRVRVSLRRVDTAIELVVADTGTGIAEEVRARIFEPMFTTKPFGEGTGLGLAIVQDIVTSSFRGTIDLASEVGVGTTFTLRLPALLPSLVPPAPAAAASERELPSDEAAASDDPAPPAAGPDERG